LAARCGLAHQKQTIGEIAPPSDKLGWGFSLRPMLQYQRWLGSRSDCDRITRRKWSRACRIGSV
jgi:hypothetical protein